MSLIVWILLLPAAALSSRGTKPMAVEAVVSEANRAGLAVDSPKVDNRKRTRQSLQSPMAEAAAATTAAGNASANTPSSAKRSRRI